MDNSALQTRNVKRAILIQEALSVAPRRGSSAGVGTSASKSEVYASEFSDGSPATRSIEFRFSRGRVATINVMSAKPNHQVGS